MKLYLDSGNFQAIKVLAAAKLSGVSVDKADVKHGSKVVPYFKDSRLPVLEVGPDQFLFSPNATVSYLLSKGGQSVSDEDQQWLEWEATQLIPVAVPYLASTVGHGRSEKDLLQLFTPLLADLEKKLKGQGHLAGTEMGAADIVIFGTLYPLSQEKAFQGVLEKHAAVKAWVAAMETVPAVQTTLTEVTGGKGVTAFKDSLLSQPLPFSATSNVKDTQSVKDTAKGQSAKVAGGAKSTASPPKVTTSSENPEVPMERVPAEEVEAAVTAWNTDVKNFPAPTPRQHPV